MGIKKEVIRKLNQYFVKSLEKFRSIQLLLKRFQFIEFLQFSTIFYNFLKQLPFQYCLLRFIILEELIQLKHIEQFSIMNESKIIQQKVMLENGQWGFKKYLIGNFLGKGGFAKCYQATQLQTQNQYAIKIINKDSLKKSREKQKLLSQIKIHKALKHIYIVKFLSVFEDNNNVYIVLELCTARSLSEMVKRRKYLTPEETRYFILQLLSALQYLHQNKVIHRDLKMANIFLNESMQLKLGDFGLSAKLEFFEERKRTMVGTPNYIAPEIIEGNGGHSYEVDLWSTGVICYALLFGRPPFETSQIKMTYHRIKNCQYNFPGSIHVPNSAKDFIKKTLVIDPKKRMTIEQMYAHPFLRGERPKSIPRYALRTDQIPIFSKDDLITQQIVTSNFSTRTSQTPSKVQLPKTIFNVITNSSYINKNQTPGLNNNSQHQKLPRTQRIQRNQKIEEPKQVNTQEMKINMSQKNLGITVLGNADYSTKYGLGYALSNGCIGVYFNDQKILAVSKNRQKYFYITGPAHNDEVIEYNHNQLPQDHDLNKKKMLLHKFQSHLKQELKGEIQPTDKEDSTIFIKQWIKTKHAIMFRLSNKIFQVDFFDKSQILLRTDLKQIKFKSKKGVEQYMMLSEALNQKERQTQLGRRIKYTKQILNSLKREQTESSPPNTKDQ